MRHLVLALTVFGSACSASGSILVPIDGIAQLPASRAEIGIEDRRTMRTDDQLYQDGHTLAAAPTLTARHTSIIRKVVGESVREGSGEIAINVRVLRGEQYVRTSSFFQGQLEAVWLVEVRITRDDGTVLAGLGEADGLFTTPAVGRRGLNSLYERALRHAVRDALSKLRPDVSRAEVEDEDEVCQLRAVVEFTIEPSGETRDVVVLKRHAPGVDHAAISEIESWRYARATRSRDSGKVELDFCQRVVAARIVPTVQDESAGERDIATGVTRK